MHWRLKHHYLGQVQEAPCCQHEKSEEWPVRRHSLPQ